MAAEYVALHPEHRWPATLFMVGAHVKVQALIAGDGVDLVVRPYDRVRSHTVQLTVEQAHALADALMQAAAESTEL